MRGNSYRGRGGDGGSWSSSSRGRGFSGPSRGRFNWYKDHSSQSFDSRSRYFSGSGGNERYSNRGRGDESYRRYSRADAPGGYSARDHSHHRSPDRKRIRTDGYPQASSGRRSHEGSYGGGNDYNSRYSYSEDKGSYGEERGRGYREDRRSAGFRDRSREDYTHRKSDQLDSEMPPPSSLPRHMSSPRGSFRGRISRGTRGMSRLLVRRDALIARKRRLVESFTARKSYLAAKAESLRRFKIQRLRRLKAAAVVKKESKGEKDSAAKGTEDISDEEKEGNWDEGEKAGEGEDEELEEGEAPDSDKNEKKVKKVKKEKTDDKEDEPEEGEEIEEDEAEVEGEEENEEMEDDEEGTEGEKKKEVKNNGGVHVTIKQDSDDRAVSEEEHGQPGYQGRQFIRLHCPHCYVRCVTFKEYATHLYRSKHINAMRKQALMHKQTLARMRLSQRRKQRIMEENEEMRGTLSSRNNFCPICKLYYRQLKAKHQGSEAHRAMRKFLLPYCGICRVGFKSPMMYENHICSLDHIKRKARLDEQVRMRRSRSDDGSGAEDGERELNLDNFMTLDSVGTVDDAGEGSDVESKIKKEGDERKSKTEINLGAEYIKKMEVYFCELCQTYLHRIDPPEKSLSLHCRSRSHLQRYVRYRDDRALRKEAERIHRKEMAKENAEKDVESKKSDELNRSSEKSAEKVGSTKKDVTSAKADTDDLDTSHNESRTSETAGRTDGENADVDLDQDLEGGMDDKLWADVDKDLGDLLREVEPGNKSSDEDDDSRAEGGRYDRFRYSEKGNVAAVTPNADVVESTTKSANGDEPVAEGVTEEKSTKKSIDSKSENEPGLKKGNATVCVASDTTTVADD